MPWTRLVALPCEISQGIVSDERAFEIASSEGTSHLGVAPVHYFWNQNGERLDQDEPTGDQQIPGRIAARLLDQTNGSALVSIPDGSVIQVPVASITERPTEVVIDVPIGSRS
jgi:hypothetical protein